MWTFLLGFLFGVISVFATAYLVLFNVFGKKVSTPTFIDQFQPLKVPKELKVFLRSYADAGFEWESCLSLSLLLHFLFQEHKDTRKFRRWVYKKLQLELNDVTARSATGRIILSIQIRDLSVGSESPVIKNVRVERYQMSEDRELFDEISFVVDVDYRGGFETSVDVSMILGRFAHLSIKVIRLSGKARIVMSRQPFAHWYFAFIEMPELDFKIDSQFQGRQLKHVIPLITQAFRKVFQRKHVWPNYKIRYRPPLPNPFLQPSPPISSFDHIKIDGTGLEVTVLQCTRLNSKLFPADHTDVYCTVSLDQRPFLSDSHSNSMHFISVLLTFTRKGVLDLIGLNFSKSSKSVKVSEVETNSTAEKCGFKKGDILVAINSVPIRNERQALRMLSGTAGDLLVLVERDLNYYFEDEIDGDLLTMPNDEDFVCISEKPLPSPSTDPQNTLIDSEVVAESFLPENVSGYRNGDEKVTKADDVVTCEEKRKSSFSLIASTSLPPLANLTNSWLRNQEKSKSNSTTSLKKEFTRQTSLEEENARATGFVDGNPLASNILFGRRLSIPNVTERIATATTDFINQSTENITSAVNSAMNYCSSNGDDTKLMVNHDRLETAEDEANCRSGRAKSTHIPKLRLYSSNCEMMRSRSESDVCVLSIKGSGAHLLGLKPLEAVSPNDNEDDQELYEDAVLFEPEAEKIGDNISRGTIDSSSLKASKRERIQARASEMALKGRARFNDLIWNRRMAKGVSPTSSTHGEAECAMDAADVSELAVDEIFEKPRLGSLELPVVDNNKVKKKTSKGVKGAPSPKLSMKGAVADKANECKLNDSSPSDRENVNFPLLITSRKTKSVTLSTEPLWGQSLHYGLDHRTTKYLNVMVHSHKKAAMTSSFTSEASCSNDSPTLPSTPPTTLPKLLGYMSVYVPQIVEDCQLTLANCHREVFHLRPPTTERNEAFSKYPELSRRTGFDARLCYGDITLGFRFFPQGLPDSTIRETCLKNAKFGNNCADRRHEVFAEPTEAHPLQASRERVDDEINEEEKISHLSQQQPTHAHKWMPIHLKHGSSYLCGICHGKIWLKWASHCTACDFVCHNKCVEKANAQHGCRRVAMNPFLDNENFIVLDNSELETTSKDSIDGSGGGTTTRRRRIANTVSEKLTNTLKNVGAAAAVRRHRALTTKADEPDSGTLTTSSQPQSPTSEHGSSTDPPEKKLKITTIVKILGEGFISMLKGSDELNSLAVERGNAYNPQIISALKSSGQNVFGEMTDVKARKTLIDQQIEIIKKEINRLSELRRELNSAVNHNISTNDDRQANAEVVESEIEELDVQRETLALLMLYYCSGLSDCMEKEEEEENPCDNRERSSNVGDNVSSSMSLSATTNNNVDAVDSVWISRKEV